MEATTWYIGVIWYLGILGIKSTSGSESGVWGFKFEAYGLGLRV